MPIATKPIIAGTLLIGVSAIWIPRLTGMEVPWLPSGDTTPLTDSTDPEEGEAGVEPDEESTTSATSTSGGHMDSLAGIVNFLEGRDGNLDASSSPPVASVSVEEEAPTYDTQVESIFGPRETDEDKGPTAEELVEEYLRTNALHTIVSGDGLITATFGFQRVQVGDFLMGGQLEVSAIAQEFVTLTAEFGPVRAHLPPPGASTYNQRHVVPHSVPGDQPFSEK